MSRDRRDQRGGHRTRMGKREKNFCCDYCYRVSGITPYPMSGNVANMDDLHNASANRLAVIQNAIGVPLGL